MKLIKTKNFGDFVVLQDEVEKELLEQDELQTKMLPNAPFQMGDKVILKDSAWEIAKPADKKEAQIMLGTLTISHVDYLGCSDSNAWGVCLEEIPYVFTSEDVEKV